MLGASSVALPAFKLNTPYNSQDIWVCIVAKGRITWEKLIDEAIRELKPQLDLLREHDLRAKARRSASS